MIAPEIEILDINDKPQHTEILADTPLVPHERQVVDEVISIWKEDPSTEDLAIAKLHLLLKERKPFWSLSEKRTRQILKASDLLNSSAKHIYSNKITSKGTPNLDLPPSIKVQFTKNRGKALYSTCNLKVGDLVFQERTPLFFIPPLDHLNLMNSSKACAYCGSLLNNKLYIKKGLDCNTCDSCWCSIECKKEDFLHQYLKHKLYSEGKKTSTKKISSTNWDKFADFCYKNKWNAIFAIALIHCYCILDNSGVLAKQFDSLARISQDIRYKVLNSNDNFDSNARFTKEQQEVLWNEGLDRFNLIFPQNPITFDQFMNHLGTYSINNIEGSIFVIQSHLNHSCDPNLEISFGSKKTDGIKVIAKRDIKANEELTISYINAQHELNQRQRELRINYGFICNCLKCKGDAKSKQRRKSSEGDLLKKFNIKSLLDDQINQEFELAIPDEIKRGPRRKSVRFDEKVVAVKN